METHQTQAGAVGQPRTVTRQKYLSVRLTENEASDSTVLDSATGPRLLLFTTKRASFFSVGVHLRFRNVMSEYGWKIVEIRPQDQGRTQIKCAEPEKIYGRKPLTAPAPAI